MPVVVTTHPEAATLPITHPLMIVETIEGPYLGTGQYNIIVPPEMGNDRTVRMRELDRWARSRGYVHIQGTNQYGPIS